MSTTPKRPRRPRAQSIRSTDPAVVLAALSDPRAQRTAGLNDLVGVIQRSRARTFGLGAAMKRPEAERTVNALVALAAARVLLDQLGAHRWAWTRDALTLGASVADVADALGLDDIEVRYGLRSWADGGRGRGELDDDQHAEIVALVDEPGVTS